MKKLNKFRTLGILIPCVYVLLAFPLLEAAWAQKPLTIRLSWRMAGQYAGLVVAQEKGYYRQEGFDVEIGDGTGALAALTTLVVGKDQFVYTSALDVAKFVDKDAPVKMVANYLKRVPMAVVSHPDVPLRTPKDLEGKRWGASPGDSFITILPTFAKMNNLDMGKIQVVHLAHGVLIPSFLERKTDLVSVYLVNELQVLESRMGVKLNALAAWDWGYDVLAHGLVATNVSIETNADMIRRIIRASTKGFQQALKDPEDAAEIMVKRYPALLSKSVFEKQVRATNNLLESKATKGKPLGWQAKEDWERTLATLEKTGEIKKQKPLAEYYTNAYLEKQ